MSHDEELSPPMTMKMEKGIKVQKWRLQTLEHDALVSKKNFVLRAQLGDHYGTLGGMRVDS